MSRFETTILNEDEEKWQADVWNVYIYLSICV